MLKKSLSILFCFSSLLLANPRMATVTGNVFLSDQTDDHSGVKVVFSAVSASATSDSVYSTTAGAYAVGLTDGIYTVSLSKTGYIPYTVPGTFTWGGGSYTLDDVSLTAGAVIEISGRQSGVFYNDFQYRVVGDITINDRDTLIIEPGTSILFMGQYSFDITGSIIAVGTEQDSIYITSGQASPGVNDWNGIRFYQSGSDSSREIAFQYCNISYGGNGAESLIYADHIFRYLPEKEMIFQHCNIHHSGRRAFYIRFSNISLTHSKINHPGSDEGIYISYSGISKIENNEITVQGWSCEAIRIYADNGKSYIRNNHLIRLDNGHIMNITNSNNGDSPDSIFVENNIFDSKGWSNMNVRTDGINYTLIEDNIFKNKTLDGTGIVFQDNDQSIFRNNLIDNFYYGIQLDNNASTTIENNIVTNTNYAFNLGGDISNANIAFNDIQFNNSLSNSESNLPVGLGDLITINANGDSADTYMNIFMDPIFTPDDSTVVYSWEYNDEDSLLYVTFTPPEEWGDTLNYVNMQLRTKYDCCWAFDLQPEFISVDGSRDATQITSVGEYNDNSDALQSVENVENKSSIDMDPRYRLKHGLTKIENGEDIQNFTDEDYRAITPADKRDAMMGSNETRDFTTTSDITFSLTVDNYASEVSWNVYNYQTQSYYYESHQTFASDNETIEIVLALDIGSYSVDCFDTYGDGGIAGTVTDTGADTVLVTWASNDYTNFGEFVFTYGEVVFGCADPNALNYDPEATAGNGSCYYVGDSCALAIDATLGLNNTDGSGQWFTYTAQSNETIYITSDLPEMDQDSYLIVYSDCDSTLVAENDDIPDNAQYSWAASRVQFDCIAGQTYYIVWEDFYSYGPFDWRLQEGHFSTDSYAGYIDIFYVYEPFNQYYFHGYNPTIGYFNEPNNDYTTTDFIANPSVTRYASYSDNLDASSPCIDAGNPDIVFYDPDGTVADMGSQYFHQGDPGTIPAPVADFTVSSTTGSFPFFVEFTSLSTGAITAYTWNFGDGNISSSTRPVHLYNQEGVYSVSLTVTGPGGESTEIKSDYITVSSPSYPPIVSFAGEPTTGLAPLTVSFTSSIINNVESVVWNFGDGETSTELNPSHTFDSVGVYTVSLSGTNQFGTDIISIDSYISVLAPSSVASSFTGSPLVGVAPHEVSFINESIGTIDSVKWNFGDNVISTQLSPVHTYLNPGIFDVSMTVFGSVNNDTTSEENYVFVYDAKPDIYAIEDIPDDQGGQVLLRWYPSGHDGPVDAMVTQYSLWEDYNGEWININNAMAAQNESYTFLASTFGDSNGADVHWSKFKVIGHTNNPSVFYESEVDSGYSIDNVPPQTPQDLVLAVVGNESVSLTWSNVDEPNFMYYNIYKNGAMIGQVTDPSFVDIIDAVQTPHYYRITSVDDGGNESSPSSEEMINTSDLDWFINLRTQLYSGPTDYYNFIGVSSSAGLGFDVNHDILEPLNPPGSFIQLAFPHPEYDLELGDLFSQDIRLNSSLADTMHIWDFNLHSNVSDSGIVFFDFYDLGNLPVLIEYLASGERMYVSDSSQFVFNFEQDSVYAFRLSIGDTTSPSLSLGDNTNGPLILLSDSTYQVTWNSIDGNTIDSIFTSFSMNGGESFQVIEQFGENSTIVDWLIPDTTISHQTILKIVAKDYAGNMIEKLTEHPITIVGDSLTVDIHSGWTLFGAPLDPYMANMSANLGDDFSGYWYTYGFENLGYTFDSTLSLSSAYWLASMEETILDIEGMPMIADVSSSLNLGWNLISNPLVLPVNKDSLLFTMDNVTKSFSEATSEGWINALYGYDSLGYNEPAVLYPWQGVWLSSLNTDIMVTFPIHSQTNDATREFRDEPLWQISFIGESEHSIDRLLHIGVIEDASDGFDSQYDFAKAPNPPGSNYVSVAINHPEWEHILGSKFATEFRGAIEENLYHEWIMSIESDDPSVTLTWQSTSIPNEFEFGYRIGGDGNYIDMTDLDSIVVSSGSELSIKIGNSVLSADVALTPKVFALHQNYPNPFNPITTVQYDLPEQSQVEIIIFDIMGREVKTLVNQKQGFGFKSVVWDATNNMSQPVSAGMYLYRISAGDFHQVKKMILLK